MFKTHQLKITWNIELPVKVILTIHLLILSVTSVPEHRLAEATSQARGMPISVENFKDIFIPDDVSALTTRRHNHTLR